MAIVITPSCRTFAAWQAAGKDSSSLAAVDPGLSGPLRLVTSAAVLALGIEPLDELRAAGPDWVLP